MAYACAGVHRVGSFGYCADSLSDSFCVHAFRSRIPDLAHGQGKSSERRAYLDRCPDCRCHTGRSRLICKAIAYETARRATRGRRAKRVGLSRRVARRALRLVRNPRRSWDSKWSHDDFSPGWRAESIPKEVAGAVESGWFQPEAAVLDVGCGSGEIAAWLARHSFDVLGIDFSGAAIEVAKARHAEAPGRLAFEVMDICAVHPDSARFSAVVDRGCFQAISDKSSYVRNIASWTLPGARVLLLADAHRLTTEQRIHVVESAFHPVFDISKTAATYIGLHPGVAIWMVRRLV